jgi:hypothetical protein
MRHWRQDEKCRRSCWRVAVCISLLAFGGADHVAAFDAVIPTDIIFISSASKNAKCIIICDFSKEINRGRSVLETLFLLYAERIFCANYVDGIGSFWSASGQKRGRRGFYGRLGSVTSLHVDARGEWQESSARDVDDLICWRDSGVFNPYEDGYRFSRRYGDVIIGVVYDGMIRKHIGTQLALFRVLVNTSEPEVYQEKSESQTSIEEDSPKSAPTPHYVWVTVVPVLVAIALVMGKVGIEVLSPVGAIIFFIGSIVPERLIPVRPGTQNVVVAGVVS